MEPTELPEIVQPPNQPKKLGKQAKSETERKTFLPGKVFEPELTNYRANSRNLSGFLDSGQLLSEWPANAINPALGISGDACICSRICYPSYILRPPPRTFYARPLSARPPVRPLRSLRSLRPPGIFENLSKFPEPGRFLREWPANASPMLLPRAEFLRRHSVQAIERWNDRAIERSRDRPSDRAIE